MHRKKDSSQDESTDACDEKPDRLEGYPFAFVLRLRVVQIVCGISTMLMGSVALIEEKGHFNLGMGTVTGATTIMAAAYSIYSSRGFDGYQPSSCKTSSPWTKLRFLGPTCRVATKHVLLWSFATALLCILSVKAVRTIIIERGDSVTILTLAVIQLLLSAAVVCAILTTLWVDVHYDPD